PGVVWRAPSVRVSSPGATDPVKYMFPWASEIVEGKGIVFITIRPPTGCPQASAVAAKIASTIRVPVALIPVYRRESAFIGGRFVFLACAGSQHPQDCVDEHAGHSDGDGDFPADVHKLIVTVAGERASEPDHEVDDDRDFHQEPEESDQGV